MAASWADQPQPSPRRLSGPRALRATTARQDRQRRTRRGPWGKKGPVWESSHPADRWGGTAAQPLTDEHRQSEERAHLRVFDQAEAKPLVGTMQPWSALIEGVPEKARDTMAE